MVGRLYLYCGWVCEASGFSAGAHIPDEEIKVAEDKFAESLHLAQMSMHNLLENDVSGSADARH